MHGGLHGCLVYTEAEKGVVERVLDGREEAEAAREKTLPNRMPI